MQYGRNYKKYHDCHLGEFINRDVKKEVQVIL
nr:MAG TPA: hypothetical protein [Caudoviricetes sp.]